MSSQNWYTSIIFHLILLGYFSLVIVESQLQTRKLQIKDIRQQVNQISLKGIAPFILIYIGSIIYFLFNRLHNPLQVYLYTSFSITLLSHSIWLTWKKSKNYQISLILLASICILARIFYPTTLTHDIFVILVVAWLGPLTASIKPFTNTIFLYLSAAWFLYDIGYVWLTKAYEQVITITDKVSFPLALTFNGESIGLADLFWASILIAMLSQKKTRIAAVLVFILSDMSLDIYAYTTKHITIFPLLVLWIPLGLVVFAIDTYKHKKTGNTRLTSIC